MIRNDEHWLSIIDSFSSAALGEHTWNIALEALADVTGSRGAQLTCVDSNTSVLLNIVANIGPAIEKPFRETAAINPRVKVASKAPVLKVLADADFITPEECRRDPFYQEVARPLDVPYICMTTLERQEGMFVALAAVRSHRDGHITSEQRDVFASIAPHARAAVRTHLALEGRSAAALIAATESLSIPLFICDRTGKVRNLTEAAVALVTSGRGLELTDGQLHASQPADAKTLRDAIDAAVFADVRPGRQVLRTVIIRGRKLDSPPTVLDVFTLPLGRRAVDSFCFAPRALVVARGPRGDDAQRTAILETVYGLTPAETHIALLVAKGQTAETVAANRGVAMGTVRAQIKTILVKMRLTRQIELAAHLAAL